jgi:alpha-D-ribose 1-methylphosphonate 5-triphosphate synthase subunit PhnL
MQQCGDDQNREEEEPMRQLLKVVNLQKRFEMHILNEKEIHALQDVSFEVNEGEIVGLTGKTGAGKSTLMNCIFRTYLVTSGQILYTDGQDQTIDLATASEQQVIHLRRTEVTYCSQFLHVIPRVPAVDVVASGLVARGRSLEEGRRDASSCLERLNLPKELWDAYPATFSGGEQQRVNIARAMISRPRFLLVDEPTASLDMKTKDAVIEMLLELKQTGTSIILITHDQYTLNKMADRSLHLEDGRVKEVVFA